MIFEDPSFWVAIAFVVLIGAACTWGNGILKQIGATFEERSLKIRSHIEEARETHQQALILKGKAQEELASAKQQAEEILEHARLEIQHMQQEAHAKLENEYQSLEIKINERLQNHHRQAVSNINRQIISLTVNAAEQVFAQTLQDPKKAAALLEHSVEDLEKHKG